MPLCIESSLERAGSPTSFCGRSQVGKKSKSIQMIFVLCPGFAQRIGGERYVGNFGSFSGDRSRRQKTHDVGNNNNRDASLRFFFILRVERTCVDAEENAVSALEPTVQFPRLLAPRYVAETRIHSMGLGSIVQKRFHGPGRRELKIKLIRHHCICISLKSPL